MKELLTKLTAFQDVTIGKNANNPFHSSKYASLDHILEVINPILLDQKLAIVHATSYIEGTPYLKTTVYDYETDQHIQSVFALVNDTNAQKVGSMITYARRYNIVQLLNLNIQGEDDDGNATMPTQQQKPVQHVKQTKVDTTTGEVKELGQCEKCGNDFVEKQGSFGTFIACSGYPNCKNIKK